MRNMKMPSDIDKEVISLCHAINRFYPDIYTVESCCGHGEKHFCIWVRVNNLGRFSELLYFFDSCHNGFTEEPTSRSYTGRAWQVKIITDCAMSYPTVLIEGGIGYAAYQQADKIADLINEHLDSEE
jgi:hypothetical protein